MPKSPYSFLEDNLDIPSRYDDRESMLLDIPPVPMRDPAVPAPPPIPEPEMLEGMTLNANDIPPEMLEPVPKPAPQDLISKFDSLQATKLPKYAPVPQEPVQASSDLRDLIKKYSDFKPDNTAMQELIKNRGNVETGVNVTNMFDKIAQAVQGAYGAKPLDMSDVINSPLKRAEQNILEEKENQKQEEKNVERKLTAFRELHNLDVSDRNEARAGRKETREEQDRARQDVMDRYNLEVSKRGEIRKDKEFDLSSRLNEIKLGDAAQMSDPQSETSRFYRALALKQNPDLDPKLVENVPASILSSAIKDLNTKAMSEYQKLRNDRADIALENKLKNDARRFDEQDENQRVKLEEDIGRYKQRINGDPMFKQLNKEGMAFDQVRALHEMAREGNEVAFSGVGTKMARAMGEVGALTAPDIKLYVTAGSISSGTADTLNKWRTGVPTGKTMIDISQIMTVLGGQIESKLAPIYDRHVLDLSRAKDIPLDLAYYKMGIPVPRNIEERMAREKEDRDKLSKQYSSRIQDTQSAFGIRPPDKQDPTPPSPVQPIKVNGKEFTPKMSFEEWKAKRGQ